jgi:hypothetical protein
MGQITKTTLQSQLKLQYDEKYFNDGLLRASPFLGLITKDYTWEGQSQVVVIEHSGMPGGSASFSVAQANAGDTKRIKMDVTTVSEYNVAQFDGAALRAAKTRKGAFGFSNLIENKMAIAKNGVLRRLSNAAFGDGSGSIGRVASTSTTTLTLANRYDAFRFHVGMKIVSSDTNTGTTDDGQEVEITAVNTAAGTLTAGANWTASGNFANNDYLFQKGDKGSVMKGVQAWIPSTAPTSGDNFFGADRSVSPAICSGFRYVASQADDGVTVERALINASAEMESFSEARCDILVMHPRDMAAFLNAMSGRVTFEKYLARAPQVEKVPDVDQFGKAKRGSPQWMMDQVAAQVNFTIQTVHLSNGSLACITDRCCPRKTAYMLNAESWELCSMGEAVGILDHGTGTGQDGAFSILPTADGIEVRMGGYVQIVCRRPHENCVVDLTAIIPN